ncbi:hypothetical protein CH373_17545 [Leptospira perolatii]|uniref:Lipid/polyisoprenoid-binding YceI-like domain-containing protein n=1 Tax=Leptospira perolatii TaxID=2023191 RepID=A0A2M9ZIH5_9LEPT|nr:hypothetical protein CH360_12390 [Leptospira perolatii]PJZ71811.1 hypothetical protein CH373_17545 [Leptospira perolatii]
MFRFCLILICWCIVSEFSSALAFEKAISFPKRSARIVSGNIRFTSIAQEEKISGSGKLITGKVDPKGKTLDIEIDLRDFKTGNRLRDLHLHDNYLESEDFPYAKYRGKILSFEEDSGKTKVIGTLSLHGKEKHDFLIEGTLSADEGRENFLRFSASFPVRLSDFSISIPSLLSLKLSENIEVSTEILLEEVE